MHNKGIWAMFIVLTFILLFAAWAGWASNGGNDNWHRKRKDRARIGKLEASLVSIAEAKRELDGAENSGAHFVLGFPISQLTWNLERRIEAGKALAGRVVT